jgi:hypothetical protein
MGSGRVCSLRNFSITFVERAMGMKILLEEIDELLSRAKYLERKQPNTPIPPDYWTRLKSACDQARQFCPDTLKNVVPDESHQTWSEAASCLETINEIIHDSNRIETE